jgi:D-proline reductase (dithiol) PrdB
MSLRAVVDRAVSRLLAPFPEVSRRWAERSASARAEGPVPWTAFTNRFVSSRVAVVTTGGFHLPDQPGFDCDRGDPSFREIPGDVDLGRLSITHTHYDTRDAHRDANILLPLDRLRELVEEEAVGSLAPTHYSLMGFIPQVGTLVGETAPEIARGLRREEVDFVLLTPA